jgi:tRNA A-37 threonylcarbamoyl transferase component Bud32
MNRRILYAASPEWASLAHRIDAMLAGPDFRPLKSNRRTLAGLLVCGGREVFVKRVDEGSWAKGLAGRIRGSRASRAIRGARMLDKAGFAHPEPLAALEMRSFGAVRSSWLITEALRKPRILSRFALADGRDFRRREWISAALAKEIRRLHNAGLYTLDLQETNLMLAARDRQLTVYFIDTEDFRRVRRVSANRRMLNLLHLDRSIGRFISRSQRLRFLYNYLGGRPTRVEARRIVGQIAAIAARLDGRKRRNRRAQSPIAAGRSAASELPSANAARN